MNLKELTKKFLDLEEGDEEIVEALKLLIETQRAYRGVEARTISRREGDNVRRTFIRYMQKQGLKTLDEGEDLQEHEFAIVKNGETDKSELRPFNQNDIWLLTDFEDVCKVWVAEDFRQVKGFSDTLISFLGDPRIDGHLKKRFVEKNKERGEKLLKAIREDKPAETSVHSLLVKLYEDEERLDEVEAEYKRFLSVADNEIVWANYGTFLEKRGRYDEAFDAFKGSFEVFERIGRAESGLGAVIKENINRVERMKNLKGDEAQKAREFWEVTWLIDTISEFAETKFANEIEKAQEEYKEAEGLEKIDFTDLFGFLTWFLFTRTLEEGRTPGMVYADQEGLSEELKEKIKGLGNAVKGDFEVIHVEPASFKFVVKEVKTEQEYEVLSDIPAIEAGLTFAGTIYPWGDFYLTGNVLKAQKEA